MDAALASDLRVALGQLIRRLRAEHNFSISQGSVLGSLDREGAHCISELARSLRVRPQSMAQTVAELERSQLVARRPDPADGRRALIELTDVGRSALEEERRQRVGWLAEAIDGELSVAEQTVLRQAVGLLARLADSG